NTNCPCQGRKISAGVNATPTKQMPAPMPKSDPTMLNARAQRGVLKNCRNAVKNSASPAPAQVNAVENRTIETVLAAPLWLTVRPRSLKKLVKNEYPAF